MARERIVFLDVAKIIGAFLVIYGHLFSANSEERIFLYSFHMPLFFLISGMFHKQLSPKESIKENFKKLLIPTFFYIAVYFVVIVSLKYLGLIKTENGNIVLNEAIRCAKGFIFGNTTLMSNGVTWFLLDLFIIKIAADSFKLLKTNTLQGTAFALAFLITIWEHPNFGFIGSAIISYPFYWLGMKYKNDIIRVSTLKSKFIILPIALALMIILPMLNGKVSIASTSLGKLIFPMNVVCFYICAIAGSLFVMSLSSFFNKNYSVVAKTSTALISIVGFQKIFTRIYYDKIGYDNNFLISFVAATIILIICVLLHYLTKKLFPRVLSSRS